MTESTITARDQFPFIESSALKEKLSGMSVTASTYPEGRTVPVGFVSPDFELRQAAYPGIYLAYSAVTKASDREHRGPTLLGYAPPGFSTDVLVPADFENKDSADQVDWDVDGFTRESSPYYVPDTPVPYNLDFDIVVLTRNYNQNFEIIAQMQDITRLPQRFGYLEVPEDGTVRTLELLGGPETSVIQDEDDKRLVQTLYSVRVAAELSLYEVQQVKRVATVTTSFTSQQYPYL